MQRVVSPCAAACQLILVIAPDWASTTAQLQRYTRASPDADWWPVGGPIKVSLGRSGLAWGVGLHGAVSAGRPAKREGDGCAPAGVFLITSLFGYADQRSQFALNARLPYQVATPDLKCIDDPASCHYNQIVEQNRLPEIDWQSHEDMLRADQRYALGAVVAHNAGQPVPGAGSCIFLHVWECEGAPTAGCTAMALADMSEIATWLDGRASPVLVQLPLVEYERLREAWGLPAFVAQG